MRLLEHVTRRRHKLDFLEDKAINQPKIASSQQVIKFANPPLKYVDVLKSEMSSSHDFNQSTNHFQSDSIVLLVCTAVFVLALLISAFFLRRHYSLPMNAGASESFVEERRKLLAGGKRCWSKTTHWQAQGTHRVKKPGRTTPKPW